MASKKDENHEFTDIGDEKPDRLKRKEDGYNPSHRGPNANRGCTDIICCLVFIIFVVGLAAVGLFAFVNGDPELLIYPEDSEGNLCGRGSYEDKKYLFFFDLVKCARMGPGVFVDGCPTTQTLDIGFITNHTPITKSPNWSLCLYNEGFIPKHEICVKECPKENFIFKGTMEDKMKAFCIPKYDESKSAADLVLDEECPAYYLESEPIINRCLPLSEVLKLGGEIVDKNGNTSIKEAGSDKTVTGSELQDGIDVFDTFLTAKEYGEKIVADVVASWWMILIGLLIAMLISLAWITLMRWVAGFMIWLTILGFVLIWGFLTVICFYLYNDYKDTEEEMTFYLVKRWTFTKENVFLAGGIIFGVIFLIVFLLLLFLCSRIRIAVSLIKEGSRAVGSMWLSLLWPIFPFLFQLGVLALFVSIATYLASIGREGDPDDNNITVNGTLDTDKIKNEVKDLFEDVPCNANASEICGYIKYAKGDFTIYLQLYNLFMLFWLINFVSALGHLTLSGAFASYYWAFNKPEDVPAMPVASALYRCFRYHLGSLAFGSLLIAIVQVIRTLLEYLDHKMKGSENRVAKFFMKCLKCCFWCLEKFLKFLTKNAFIMMAVYGKNFCASGLQAFNLIIRNPVRVVVVDKVTDFVLFVCKLVVVGVTGVIAYFFFNGNISYLNDYNPKLNFYIVPIILVVVGSYLIADVFFSVYEMAVDTLFMCFLEDLELNDGSADKPYFMSKDLMDILGEKNE